MRACSRAKDASRRDSAVLHEAEALNTISAGPRDIINLIEGNAGAPHGCEDEKRHLVLKLERKRLRSLPEQKLKAMI